MEREARTPAGEAGHTATMGLQFRRSAGGSCTAGKRSVALEWNGRVNRQVDKKTGEPGWQRIRRVQSRV